MTALGLSPTRASPRQGGAAHQEVSLDFLPRGLHHYLRLDFIACPDRTREYHPLRGDALSRWQVESTPTFTLRGIASEDSFPLALRASDAERERAAELLREAMASGRLSVDELEDRTQRVFEAKTRTDLERLLGDVMVPADDDHPVAGKQDTNSSGLARTNVRAGTDGTRRVLSILSGSKRTGKWRLAVSCSVINVLGGSQLDLSEVELAEEQVELKVISVLGGSEITLPPGLNVKVSEVAILGGNEVNVSAELPDPGGPVVHLHLVSILGGSKVWRGPEVTPKERNELEGEGRP